MSATEKRLLLVEDTPADIVLAQAALADAPQTHTCLSFNDGETALAYLKTQPDALPDLILLDLNLPGMRGREVLAEIKSSTTLRHIPVVILTTSNAQRDRQDAYAAHANSFVTKPANLDDYARTMCEIVHYWFETVTLPNATPRTGF
jgi:CheY-like chemotaxis protein